MWFLLTDDDLPYDLLFTISDHNHVNSGINWPQVDNLVETAIHLNISDFTDLYAQVVENSDSKVFL